MIRRNGGKLVVRLAMVVLPILIALAPIAAAAGGGGTKP
jgi:hypothetical protein